jgi:putative oxidoreductase
MKTAVLSSSVPVSVSQPKSFTRFFPAIARVVMGAPLVVFGLNGFLNFIPPPTTPLPETAMTFATALAVSGYMMPLIGVTLLIVGALLVANRFVPLALVLMAPFLVNSLAFHFFLEPTGRPPAVVFTILELYLAWSYRAAYRPLFVARTQPAS